MVAESREQFPRCAHPTRASVILLDDICGYQGLDELPSNLFEKIREF